MIAFFSHYWFTAITFPACRGHKKLTIQLVPANKSHDYIMPGTGDYKYRGLDVLCMEGFFNEYFKVTSLFLSLSCMRSADPGDIYGLLGFRFQPMTSKTQFVSELS